MKKQHLFRLSAILLFLSLILGIMPRNAFLAYAAEETASVLPEDGKTYVMWGTWVSNKTTTKPRTYGMHPLGIRNGVNFSYLSTNGYPPYFVNTCFSFEEVETGVFKILPVSMPGFCLQVGNIWTNGEATTHAAVFENKPEQLWTLKPCEDGYYLSCMSAPDQVLGNSGGWIQPIPIDSKDRIIFSFEEATVEFPDSKIYVKAPEGWHPGLWVTPEDKLEDTLKWGGLTIMEKNKDGWFSYPAPWDSNCDCDIVNQAVTGAGAMGYKHDELFSLEGIDFSTDKWVVITDDPNVDGDLTYQVYDYNPDEPPKTADPVTLTIPALSLLLSSIAIIYLLRRRKTAL